ncbi:unspecific monooxygenase [Salvia divinorum]|uniref:Unspecific monooxygenase n=1 Tax=Salvia divinorum TaxID=28513 RepID=A0ABD1GP51_SALDI
MFSEVSVISLFLLTIFLIKIWPITPPKPSKNLPPSPQKLPIIGNLHQIGPSPHRKISYLARKHGPLMLLHLGKVPLLVASSADAARDILKTHDQIFSNRPNSSVANAIYDCKDIAFSAYGDYWRQMRSICVNHLLSSKKVQSFRDVREEEVFLMMERIREAKSVVNLSELFANFANDVICRVALGRKYEDGGKFKKVLEELGVLLGSFDVGEFVPWLYWIKFVNGMSGRVRGVARNIDEFLECVVREHIGQKGEGEKDFVDVLLELQRNERGGFVLDDTSIKALILDMFAAGSDTTFTLMEWTLSELIRHKKVMAKLKAELKRIAGCNSTIAEADLDKCQYLKAVIKETLRLHPPLPLLVPRESTHDAKLLGYDIAARTRVVINAWAIGRDPLLWEDAEEFIPERFLNTCIDFKGQFQFLPFGAGRRGCPGAAFALGAVELLLSNLVLGFEFALPGGERGEDLDMVEGDGLTIHRKFPLCAVPICES